MLLLRVLGGLIAATVVGMILGAIKDYLGLWPDAAFKFVWPLGMGAAAFVGALVMALLKPSRMFAGSNPTKELPTATARQSSAGQHPAGKSHEVPGMPTFDFDKSRAAATAQDAAQQPVAAAPTKPKEQA